MSAQGYVYFLHAVGTDNVKVGWTRDLPGRFQALSTACPYPLYLLAVHPGSKELESAYHADLRSYHQNGEWFQLTAEVRRWLVVCLRGTYTADFRRLTRECPELVRRGGGGCPAFCPLPGQTPVIEVEVTDELHHRLN